MNKGLFILILMIAPIFAVSCLNREVGDNLSSGYVKEVLSDTLNGDFLKIKTASAAGVDGTITILGSAEEVFSTAEAFLSADDFNNIDGRTKPDGLPDFAGETLSVITDFANSPYGGYSAFSNESFISESAARIFVSATDTVCALNRYDRNAVASKKPVKVMVLSSPYLSAYGYSDIQVLNCAAGEKIKVVSPIHSIVEYSAAKYTSVSNVAIWTTGDIEESGVYRKALSEIGGDAVNCVVVSDDSSAELSERVMSVLERCDSLGGKGKLSAVFVDDISLDVTALNALLKDMLDLDNEDAALLSDYLAPGFEFVDKNKALVDACVRYLRKSNKFTHKVAYPNAQFYSTAPVADTPVAYLDDYGQFKPEYMYNRAPDQGEETFVLVEMTGRHISDSLAVKLKKRAPKTFEFYVSK